MMWLFTITWGLLFTSRQAFRGRGGEHDIGHEGDDSCSGAYRLPQASSSFVPHDCGVSRLVLLRLLVAKETFAFPAGVRLLFQATVIRQRQLTVMNLNYSNNYVERTI
ncbi:hypothetical protein A6K76_13805 [Caryophanon latum]|uniref:Uncharacterized protein n=1 Tax=Caryophanon latum TaxID=33977 RepID=A0A1C0YL17_9BACL|nr:hypothetical protein A6K76_13805 [Caryophanon latum]